MAPFLLLVGAFIVIGGCAMVSMATAVIALGSLVMLSAVGVAVVQDRSPRPVAAE